MAELRTRIGQRRDTHSNWLKYDPTPINGEIILVDIEDEIRVKIGNGVDKYSALPFNDEAIKGQIETHEAEIIASDAGVHGYRLNEANKTLDILSADTTIMYQIPLYIAD